MVEILHLENRAVNHCQCTNGEKVGEAKPELPSAVRAKRALVRAVAVNHQARREAQA